MMMMNLFKNFFVLFFMIMIIVCGLFLNDMIMIWIFMEISTFLFVVYVILDNKNLKSKIINYYIIQAICSMMLLFFILMLNHMFMTKMGLIFDLMFILTIFMKIGLFPFHKWYINLIDYMSWNSMFYLMTLQKFYPMLMYAKVQNFNLIYMFIFFFMFLMVNVMSELTLKGIFSYSSIYHTYVLLIISGLSYNLFLIYMIFYFFMMFMVVKMLEFYLIYNFFDFYKVNINLYNKFFILMMVLSLAMLPPMFSFFVKWYMMMYMVFNNMYMFMLIVVMFSLFFFYIYLRSFIVLMLKNNLFKLDLMMLNFWGYWIMIFLMLNMIFIISLILKCL